MKKKFALAVLFLAFFMSSAFAQTGGALFPPANEAACVSSQGVAGVMAWTGKRLECRPFGIPVCPEGQAVLGVVGGAVRCGSVSPMVGMGRCGAQQVVSGVENGKLVCTDKVLSVHCPKGQFITGMNASGDAVCAPMSENGSKTDGAVIGADSSAGAALVLSPNDCKAETIHWMDALYHNNAPCSASLPQGVLLKGQVIHLVDSKGNGTLDLFCRAGVFMRGLSKCSNATPTPAPEPNKGCRADIYHWGDVRNNTACSGPLGFIKNGVSTNVKDSQGRGGIDLFCRAGVFVRGLSKCLSAAPTPTALPTVIPSQKPTPTPSQTPIQKPSQKPTSIATPLYPKCAAIPNYSWTINGVTCTADIREVASGSNTSVHDNVRNGLLFAICNKGQFKLEPKTCGGASQ